MNRTDKQKIRFAINAVDEFQKKIAWDANIPPQLQNEMQKKRKKDYDLGEATIEFLKDLLNPIQERMF